MNLCIIIPSFYPAVIYGGWVFSSINTCRELTKLGVKSYVSTTNDNGSTYLNQNYKEYKEIEKNIFVKYYPETIREKFSFKMLLHLWKDIKNTNVVHIQAIFSLPTPIGLFYARILKKKVLLSPHGCLGSWCLSDGNKFKRQYLSLFIEPYANDVVWHATSVQEEEEIKQLFPKAKVKIIPNGINMEEFSTINFYSKAELVKKFTGKTMNVEKLLISMSRLHKKKGLDILLKAFKKVKETNHNTILLIAGDDFGEKNHLQKLVKELELENNVYFIGHIAGQDRIDFFANADVFVLPSHNENFGMVYAEAMASGTPVVASTNTPWKEVEEFSIGKWVENDPDLTAKAIIELFEKDLLLLGQESRKFIEQNYSWSSVGIKFKKVLEELSSDL